MALSEAYLEWEQRVEARGIEQGIERGVEQGVEQGERALILRQLVRKVGALPEGVRSRISAMSIERLNELGEALLNFSELSDVEAWLLQHQ